MPPCRQDTLKADDRIASDPDVNPSTHENSDPTQMLIDASEKAGEWTRAADVVRSMRDADVQSQVLAHRIMYAPLVQALLPAPLLKAARATVATGRAARRWITST